MHEQIVMGKLNVREVIQLAAGAALHEHHQHQHQPPAGGGSVVEGDDTAANNNISALYMMSEAVRAENIRIGGLKEEFTWNKRHKNGYENGYGNGVGAGTEVGVGNKNRKKQASEARSGSTSGVHKRSGSAAAVTADSADSAFGTNDSVFSTNGSSFGTNDTVFGSPDAAFGPVNDNTKTKTTADQTTATDIDIDTVHVFDRLVKLKGVCEFSCSAQHLSGNNGLLSFEPLDGGVNHGCLDLRDDPPETDIKMNIDDTWDQIVPSGQTVLIEGLLDRTTAGKYLNMVGKSKVQQVSSFVMQISKDKDARMQYERLYEFLSRQDKYGVIQVPSVQTSANGATKVIGATVGYLATLSKGEEVPNHFCITDERVRKTLEQVVYICERVVVVLAVVPLQLARDISTLI